MKKKFLFIFKTFALLISACLFINFSSFAPAGLSGAPGDGTCNNCHFGGTQTGTVDMTGIVDVDNQIIPNKTYNVTVTITLTSGISTRAGFQFVALDGNTASSPSTGTFSNLGTNVGTMTSGSRTYVGNSGGENTYSGGDVTYTFDWTAPAVVSNNISFYVTGNIANGSGTGNDLIVFDSDQNVALPVDLVDFKLFDRGSSEVELNWSTASESNSDYFEILRSEDGRNYDSIGKVSAAGFSDRLLQYTFLDQQPILNKSSFYRLGQFDFDGQMTYSEIKTIQVMDYDDLLINIFPNPVRNNECLFIDYLSEKEYPDAVIRIYDIYGRSVLEDPQMFEGIKKGFNKFVFDLRNLTPGQYFLSISEEGSSLLETRSFVMK